MSTAAVVGIGDISALHLDAIRANRDIELVGVCDVDAARAEAAGRALGVPFFTDHRELLRAVSPRVVHITTPHDQHVPVALDALEAGAHVLTEKPIGQTVAAGRCLVDRAAASDRKVGVVFQNRYNPTAVAIKDAITSGALGPITGARAAVWWFRPSAYYTAAPWRGQWLTAGGGVMINQAIHTLDLLLWYLGAPSTVHGVAATLSLTGVIEVEDTATIVIDHDSGVRSTLFATNAHHTNADIELEITGRDGSVRLVGGEAWLTDDGGTRRVATDTQSSGERSYWGKGHSLLIDDFHARLDDPGPFWIGPADGLVPLQVLREVYRQSGILPEGHAL
ncbi:MAG TPA: Gfo/Idh/MocA family oxidoreductase [Propionicimonas sp.]|uniref:Gfo/Idh/MocA family protein n=1 Tax=Propionicimonas sp. TaxID=1955623 RepID=UPI002F42516F